MNSYIKTIFVLTWKNLFGNMFIITIYANAIKVLNLRNQAFFSRYYFPIKDNRTLA